MRERIVCPFYRRNDEECDVGCDYISPHDVRVIIRYCSAHYQDCFRYRQLVEKRGEEGAAAAPLFPLSPAAGTTAKEAAVHACAAQTTDSLAEKAEIPSPLGLLVLGLTMLLLNLNGAGLFPLSAMILGVGILYGGVGQVLIGILEWRRGHPFSCAAFSSLGLFWLSKIAMEILPRTGFGKAPQASAMVSYLAMWAVFAFLLFLGTFRLDRKLQIVFASLFVHLGLQAGGFAGAGSLAQLLAHVVGIFGGVTAIYAAAALRGQDASVPSLEGVRAAKRI